MKNPIIFLALVTLFLLTGLLFPEILPAQPPPPVPPAHTPIDGGLAFLAAAGGVYAIKKLARRSLGEGELRDRHKQEQGAEF